MNNGKRTFWIDDRYLTEPKHANINFELAGKFLCQAKRQILEIDRTYHFQRGAIARDFIRLGNEENTTDLSSGLSEHELQSFHYNIIRGKASKYSVDDLLGLIHETYEYGKIVIAERLIAEGFIDDLLNNIKIENLTKESRNKLIDIFSDKTDQPEFVIELFNKYKESNYVQAGSNSITRMLKRLINNGSISFERSLEVLNKCGLYSDISLGIIASIYGAKGDMHNLRLVLNLIKSGKEVTNKIIWLAKLYYLKYNNQTQLLFLELLNSVKNNHEARMLKDLFKNILNPTLQVDSNLLSFYEKYKSKQVDDLIHEYLLLSNRIEESIKFTENTLGHNRFKQFEKSLKGAIELGNLKNAIQKAKEIKSNEVRIEVINKLCEMGYLEIASKAKTELLDTKHLRHMTDSAFCEYYAKTENIPKLEELLFNKEFNIGQVMDIHNIARHFMGLKFRNVE